MNLATVLYLVDLIHSLDCLSGLVMIFYILSLGIVSFAWCVTHDEDIQSVNNTFNKGRLWLLSKIWIWFIAIGISILLPTQKTMYLMLGSVYLSKTNLPAKVSQAIELKLDDVIKELKKENK